MALERSHRASPVWPPEMFRRLLDQDWFESGRMRIEQFKEGDTLVVRAELPGIDPDKDLQVTADDGSLRIHAEREEQTKTEENGAYQSEFRYGCYDRVLPLPRGVDAGAVTANYDKGILTIRVPMPAEAEGRAKEIRVSVGQ